MKTSGKRNQEEQAGFMAAMTGYFEGVIWKELEESQREYKLWWDADEELCFQLFANRIEGSGIRTKDRSVMSELKNLWHTRTGFPLKEFMPSLKAARSQALERVRSSVLATANAG